MTKLTKADWLVPGGLVLLALIPAIAGGVRLTELAGGAEVTAANARFVDAPLPVVLHILGALVYSILGAFQFAPGLRRRFPQFHRGMGRVIVGAGVVVAVSGLWMAQFTDIPGESAFLYLQRMVFGALMLGCLIVGVGAILERDVPTHKAMMVRAYAIAMGAGTQVFTHLVWLPVTGEMPVGVVHDLMMLAGWAINLAVAEFLVLNTRLPQPSALLA